VNVYCHGELVGTYMSGGWIFCGGCGHRMWRIDATFALEGAGIKSEHGNENECQADREAGDGFAAGAVQA
jgi:hypothetical protein